MSNMGVELGAKFTLFEADEKTMAYLKGRTDQAVKPFGPDPDAEYVAVMRWTSPIWNLKSRVPTTLTM